MQCRYREHAYFCGDMIFLSVVPEWRKSGSRRGKFRPTSEDQKRLNEKYAILRLLLIIHENFTKHDLRFDLTYNDRYLPEDEEQADRDYKSFIRKLRRLYRKKGIEFKYVVIPAYTEKGRPHFHLIIPGGVSYEELHKLWGMGRTRRENLEFDECGIVDLGFYFGGQKKAGKTQPIHERAKGERRWIGSRNLKKPVEKTNVHTYARHELEMLSDAGVAKRHYFFSLAYPGYWLSEQPSIHYNPINRAYYMDAVLYRPDSGNLADYARRGDDEIKGRRRRQERERG